MTSDQDVTQTTEPQQPEALLDVWLLRYPLRLGGRASEHYESIYRECALLATDQQGSSVAGRLIALVEELGRRSARNNEHEQEREAALARGEQVLDIRLQVPASVATLGRRLTGMLDQTDDFCRQGLLLTLAPGDDVVAFRRWYLDQLVGQVGGGPPQPWPGEPT